MVQESKKWQEKGQGRDVARLAAFCTALRFLTILPVRFGVEDDANRFPASVAYFTLVGMIIGLLAALLCLLLQAFLPQMVAVCLLIIFLAGISNFFHLDGFADSADGLFSSRSREKSLEIMKDSRVGAMAVIALIFLLLLKFSALASVNDRELVVAVFFMPILGRLALVLGLTTEKYARTEGGLGTLFYSPVYRKAAFLWILFFILALCLWGGTKGLVLLVLLMAVLTAFNWKCRRQLGGATGDTLGAQCELAEVVVALFFSMS